MEELTIILNAKLICTGKKTGQSVLGSNLRVAYTHRRQIGEFALERRDIAKGDEFSVVVVYHCAGHGGSWFR